MKQGRQAVDARRAKILALIRERRKIKVEELSILFGVSFMTIRRDLQALEDLGQIGRFYGGASVEPYAVSVNEQDETAFYRDFISRRAADLIESGDKIFINGSRTALELLRYIQREPVQVFTNNGLAVGFDCPSGVEITISGGVPRGDGGRVLTGDCAMRNLLMTRADKAFMGCSGISPDGEILCDIPTELGVNETMISHAYQYYILADHTKIGKTGAYASFALETPGTIITDELAPPVVLERLKNLGMKIIRVSKSI